MTHRNRLPRRIGRDSRLSENESRAFSEAADQAFQLQAGHGYAGLLLRGIFQSAAWLVIALAIHRHGLDTLLVLAPWVLEFLLLTWGGLLLSRTLIDDPIFRKINGHVSLALLWSAIVLLPILAVVSVRSGLDLTRMASDLEALIRSAWEHQVITAGLLIFTGLILDTSRDLRAWRQSGGVFVWPATQRFGLRFTALIGLLLISPFLLAGLITLWGLFGDTSGWLSHSAQFAWLVFGLLVAADLGELMISAWLIHRFRRPGRPPSIGT
jgi:hypothetical protein